RRERAPDAASAPQEMHSWGRSSARRASAKHAVAFHRHDELVGLVEHFPTRLHDPHIRAALRCTRLEHLAPPTDRVTGAHWLQPSNVVDTGRTQAGRLD